MKPQIISNLKKGTIFEVLPIKSEDIKESDLLGKKIFLVSKFDSIWQNEERHRMIVDLFPCVLEADGRLIKIKQIFINVNHKAEVRTVWLNCFGFYKFRTRKKAVFGNGGLGLRVKLKIRTGTEIIF